MSFALGEHVNAMVMYWARPVLILICGMLLFNLPTLLYKSRLFAQAILYLLFCNDKKWKKPEDPGIIFAQLRKEGVTIMTQSSDDTSSDSNSNKSNGTDNGNKIEKKTIYLVRHGESTWNDTFNKGKHRSAIVFAIGFIPGLIKAILYELYIILSGKMDSWFYDSPLSQLGLSQVNDLGNFLKKPPRSKDPEFQTISILRGDPSSPPSKILCSSLRRAISTMAAGFRDRLSRHPEEKILIVPSLQEISRNPDTLSITPAHTSVTASWMETSSKQKICDFSFIFRHQVDVSLHNGNKPIATTNGLIRMTDFCNYVFTLKEDHIICGGHSIWFRSFFRTYLPCTIDHVSKTRKVVNCGVVALTLMKATTVDGKCHYMIDPQSIKAVHGGFD